MRCLVGFVLLCFCVSANAETWHLHEGVPAKEVLYTKQGQIYGCGLKFGSRLDDALGRDYVANWKISLVIGSDGTLLNTIDFGLFAALEGGMGYFADINKPIQTVGIWTRSGKGLNVGVLLEQVKLPYVWRLSRDVDANDNRFLDLLFLNGGTWLGFTQQGEPDINFHFPVLDEYDYLPYKNCVEELVAKKF